MLQVSQTGRTRSRARTAPLQTGGAPIFRIDRRRAPRRAAEGRVTAVRRDPVAGPAHHRLFTLNLRNISETGLGVMADGPLEVDEAIAIHFPPHGVDAGFVLNGHVVRCEPVGARIADEHTTVEGYEIGIHFDPRTAA